MEIVLTAHPTQVNRRTLQYKFTRIATFLERYERSETSTYEKEQVLDELARFIRFLYSKPAFPLPSVLCFACGFPAALNLRRRKPTPLDEARGGLHIIEQSLWVRVVAFTAHSMPASASCLFLAARARVTPVSPRSFVAPRRAPCRRTSAA